MEKLGLRAKDKIIPQNIATRFHKPLSTPKNKVGRQGLSPGGAEVKGGARGTFIVIIKYYNILCLVSKIESAGSK